MRRFSILLVIGLTVLSLCSVIYFNQSSNTVVNAQDINQIAESIMTRLCLNGIPVGSPKIEEDKNWDPPFIIEYVLQSSSKDNKLGPNDMVKANIASHEITIEAQQNLNIGAMRLVIVNGENKVIYKEERVIKRSEEITVYNESNGMQASDIASDLQEIELDGMSLNKLEATADTDGLFHVLVDLCAPDVQTADHASSILMENLRMKISDLNKVRAANIAVYQVNIASGGGEIFLKYINDLQVRRQSMWHNPGIKCDWFSQPET